MARPDQDLKKLFVRLKRAGKYFTQPRSAWLVTIVSVIIMSLTEPLVPALLKPLLDEGFQGGKIQIWLVPLCILGLFGIRGLSGFIGQVTLAKVANLGLFELRKTMFTRLQDAHPSLFRLQTSSALGNTLVYEVQSGAYMMVNAILSVTRDSLALTALIGYLLYLNWKLSLIVAFLFPSVAWLMKVATKRLFKLTTSNQKATDELAYVVEENALAYREIRLYGAQQSQINRFGQLGKTLERLAMKSTVSSSALTPLTQMISAIALSAVISIALMQSSKTGITVGGFAAFVTGMLMLVAPIKHLSEVAGPITRGLAALERGLDLIENTPVETGGTHCSLRSKGAIVLKDVSVQYRDDAPAALTNISLCIEPGETVALVGASGSGKTTLANLLPRILDTNSGEVLLDGVNVRDWDLKNLRLQFAMVSQNVIVLNDTLAANVALGQAIDNARVKECLISANLGAYLESLPEQENTVVGHNASQLSGGQRQRLAIARALYKDAPILILDEATSALDNESESMVQRALIRLQKDRTTLVIAHRLSTIEHAQRIMVMESGRITESGTHRDLLNKDGAYAALFKLGRFGNMASNSVSSNSMMLDSSTNEVRSG
jgi:subfamily B ATP-binding cassette protein MsbA